MINRSPATAKKPEFPNEEREGIFSSLPLTFFSPSVPQSTIDLFIENGGLALPRLDPMELQYYFKSPFTKDHPFYNVDLIFVTGPNDLLGTVLRERVLIYYDCRWVERCVEKGEMLDMVRYIVDFPIKAEVEEGEEDDELQNNVDGNQVNPPSNNNVSNLPSSQLNNPPLSDPLPSRTALPKTDNLLKYAVRTVPPSAFTSESALRKASFNPNSASRFRASTAPFTRPRFPTPTNAIAGPSKLKDELESQEPEQTFNPIDYSSQRVSSEESAIPVLQIPHRKLDEIKFREFETWIKECKVHDLEDFYPELMECGKDDKIIRGLEAGLLG
jgi:hypothetical protein